MTGKAYVAIHCSKALPLSIVHWPVIKLHVPFAYESAGFSML